jgi:hypothetical protein
MSMVRVGPEQADGALAEAHVRPMDFTGTPMRGYVYVGPDGTIADEALAKWVELGARFVSTLEAKKKRRPTAAR